MIKKLGSVAVITLLMTLSVAPVYAESVKDARGDLRDARQDVRDTRKDLKETVQGKIGSGPGILRDLLQRGRAAIGSGKVTVKNGTTLTIEKDGKSYTVLTDSKTQFRRRFWGKSSLDEISVNDMVNVIGQWTDDAHTTIQARLVRDISIQKRFGVFFGIVKSVTGDGWVMSTIGNKRPDQTVIVSSTTKLVNRREQPIVKGDIVVGHRVRVKGLWDRVSNTVTEVRQVKDFSLPQVPSGTVTPSITVTPTSTPTPTATPTP